MNRLDTTPLLRKEKNEAEETSILASLAKKRRQERGPCYEDGYKDRPYTGNYHYDPNTGHMRPDEKDSFDYSSGQQDRISDIILNASGNKSFDAQIF